VMHRFSHYRHLTGIFFLVVYVRLTRRLSQLFFSKCCNKFEVLHDACNTSDHDPILLQLDVAIARCDCSLPQQFRSKPAWQRANESQIADYCT